MCPRSSGSAGMPHAEDLAPWGPCLGGRRGTELAWETRQERRPVCTWAAWEGQAWGLLFRNVPWSGHMCQRGAGPECPLRAGTAPWLSGTGDWHMLVPGVRPQGTVL